MILERLAEGARKRVEEAKRKKPLEEIRREAEGLRCSTGFPFAEALRSPGMSFICEVKKASPSKGMLAENFPYLEIAKEYEKAGAAAISVLTEPEKFLGSDEYLREIAAAVKIPVLRKDFTVDPYQIYEAKLLGAGAVLLICALLSEGEVREYLEVARSLGLSALVETHDEREVEQAVRAGAEIIGVNNRDLRTFEVDVNNSLRLKKWIPGDKISVSESGIRTAEDVGRLYRNGTDAVLIGETLMRCSDKKAKLEELRAECRGER